MFMLGVYCIIFEILNNVCCVICLVFMIDIDWGIFISKVGVFIVVVICWLKNVFFMVICFMFFFLLLVLLVSVMLLYKVNNIVVEIVLVLSFKNVFLMFRWI